eukprot:14500759-Alexandrium_andersonii.AAC.1
MLQHANKRRPWQANSRTNHIAQGRARTAPRCRMVPMLAGAPGKPTSGPPTQAAASRWDPED